ncbi:hypothetical protein LUZ61_010471 [Rhynchospora tenuis]|uniref:DUF4378 domain-containing protein n=1 Tax=Rhynchospora tenuis TaxID=198213 RepID=A0AAD6EZA5_9POAL|nr:hypothetical protein LUZ61_010471 [Rhynchospora tenuis]
MTKHYPVAMKNRTNKWGLQHDSENVGCVSSIFRMFDFRRNPKLISYLNYSGKHAVVNVNAKSKNNEGIHECVQHVNKNTRAARPGMQSVKTLMEEEMAKLIPASMIPGKNFQMKPSENKTEVKLQKKFYPEINKPNSLMFPQSPESFDFTNQIDCYDLDSCLSEFSSREIYSKKDKSNCKPRDSNSIIQECLSGLDQSEELCKTEAIESINHSFRKREKSKTNQGYSRIVILKPSLSRINSPLERINDKRGFQHLSVTEIKSRLRQTIIESRKERELISIATDSLHNASKLDSVETEETKVESVGAEEAERIVGSFSYEMAKMHLMERVDNIGKNDLKISRKKKSLSSLFSLPDFDSLSSPICTPRKEDDVSLLAEGSKLMCSVPLKEECNVDILNPLVRFKEREDDCKVTTEELDILGSDTQGEEMVGLRECLDSLEGKVEEPESSQISEEDDTSNSHGRPIDIAAQPFVTKVIESTDTSEKNIKDSCSVFLHDEAVPDDIVRFTSRTTKHEEIPIQRTTIRFKEFDISSFLNPTYETPILDDKETRSEFVRVVVKASSLCERHSERWRADGPLLDLFLYDEIGMSYDYSDDSKYLFDLIEEVLNEMRNIFFIPSPWVWSTNKRIRSVPVGEDLIKEVCKGVDLLLNHKFPCTLDQIVAKDFEYASWMDTRPDIEVIVLEIGDDTLDDLLEEAIFDLWFS